MDDIGTPIPRAEDPETPDEEPRDAGAELSAPRRRARLRGATSFKLTRWRRARIKLIY